MLQIEHVSKTFNPGTINEKKALIDLNVSLKDGDFATIVGSNGAGKSTFLRILSGQLEPTNGDVVITPGQRLSFLQQDHFKYDEYPVLDTVIIKSACVPEDKY